MMESGCTQVMRLSENLNGMTSRIVMPICCSMNSCLGRNLLFSNNLMFFFAHMHAQKQVVHRPVLL